MSEEILKPNDAVDVMNHDANRLRYVLSDVESTVRVYGPMICIKTTKIAFPVAYKVMVDGLRREIIRKTKGRRYVILEIACKQLQDADRNFWGDYAQFMLDVGILKRKWWWQ